MNIVCRLPDEAFFLFVTNFNGIEIAKLRTVSKSICARINNIESLVYHSRMRIEYSKIEKKYDRDWKGRTDWKNIYIITDQYIVTKNKAAQYRHIIEGHQCFLLFEKISVVTEMILGILSASISIAKVASLGWSDSRALIHGYLCENPGSNFTDAVKALGLSSPQTIGADIFI